MAHKRYQVLWRKISSWLRKLSVSWTSLLYWANFLLLHMWVSTIKETWHYNRSQVHCAYTCEVRNSFGQRRNGTLQWGWAAQFE